MKHLANILTSSFHKLRFLCMFFFPFVRFYLFVLIKKQFSLSIFSLPSFYRFFSFLHCRFSATSSFGPLVVFDYLLNDIMTSNLVINQILIVLFVAVNIRQIRFFFLRLIPWISSFETQRKWRNNVKSLLVDPLLPFENEKKNRQSYNIEQKREKNDSMCVNFT